MALATTGRCREAGDGDPAGDGEGDPGAPCHEADGIGSDELGGAQPEHGDHERRGRHHPDLATHDVEHQLALLGPGRWPTAALDSSPRWSSTVCAEATRSCSAMKLTPSGVSP